MSVEMNFSQHFIADLTRTGELWNLFVQTNKFLRSIINPRLLFNTLIGGNEIFFYTHIFYTAQ